MSRRRRRCAKHEQHRKCHGCKDGLTEEASGEGRSRKRIAGPNYQLRAYDRCDQATDHDAGDRLLALRRGGIVSRGKPVALYVGGIEACETGAQAEHKKAGEHNPQRSDQARNHADHRAQQISGLASEPTHHPGGRQGPERQPKAEKADGKRDQIGIGR